jgi:hypothetical protein
VLADWIASFGFSLLYLLAMNFFTLPEVSYIEILSPVVDYPPASNRQF